MSKARLRFPVLRAAVPLLLAAALGACGSGPTLDGPVFEAPETAVEYTVAVEGLPNEDMLALAEASLATYRRQDDGAQSVAFLRRRAEGDVELIQKLLRSRGYFAGRVEVEVSVEEPPAADGAAADGADAPETQAQVRFTVEPGAAFTLTRHDFDVDDPSGTAPELSAKELGSPVGAAAAAEPIVDAETAAVETLRNFGFPYAERGNRRAVADLEAKTLEIDTPLATGPAAIFGPVLFEGLKDVRARYLLTYLPWTEGDRFDRSKLRTFQRALHPAGTARQMAAIVAHGNRRPHLERVTVPTLVIHGSDDPLVHVEGGHDTHRAVPGAELLLIEGMGHDLPVGTWDRIVDALSAHSETHH